MRIDVELKKLVEDVSVACVVAHLQGAKVASAAGCESASCRGMGMTTASNGAQQYLIDHGGMAVRECAMRLEVSICPLPRRCRKLLDVAIEWDEGLVLAHVIELGELPVLLVLHVRKHMLLEPARHSQAIAQDYMTSDVQQEVELHIIKLLRAGCWWLGNIM